MVVAGLVCGCVGSGPLYPYPLSSGMWACCTVACGPATRSFQTGGDQEEQDELVPLYPRLHPTERRQAPWNGLHVTHRASSVVDRFPSPEKQNKHVTKRKTLGRDPASLRGGSVSSGTLSPFAPPIFTPFYSFPW